jgi:hypothetical protein
MSGKDSCRDGKWKKGSIFTYHKLDEAGAADFFETSQVKTDTPTLLVDTYRSHPTMKTGLIHRIHYRLNPTAAVTYILRIWRAALADNYASNACMLYESAPLRADDIDYDVAELNIPFWLYTPGNLYYSIEWTGAPGNTTGFIEVTGEAVD